MKTVFLLQHSYEQSPDCEEEVKTIGIYESRDEAEAAIGRLSQQPGFSDFPDHFIVDEYELGRDCWQEGFVTDIYTPRWEIWQQDANGMLSRIETGLTENEALRSVRDRELSGSSTCFAKEVR